MEVQIDELIKFVKKANHKIVKDLEALKGVKRKEPEPEITTTTTVVDNFKCPGRVWETPVQPCVGGERSTIKDRIRYKPEDSKKNIFLDVCRGCKNSKKRKRSKPTISVTTVEEEEENSE